MRRYVPTGASTSGGLGHVVVCTDRNLDRKVVIKYGNQERRLLDELSALQRIRSKHVVEIFDVVSDKGSSRLGVVEEYIDGQELSTKLGTIKRAVDLVPLLYQLASGLADIHAVDIVHRDIKPSNILIDGDQILKIIDFDLARLTSDANTSGFVGTRGYAAPELYSPGHVTFDPKVDVYAMGVTALALVSGKSLPRELRRRPPTPNKWKTFTGGFRALAPKLDNELVRLLDACLSRDPDNRPAVWQVRDRAERVMLRGRHRAAFVMRDQVFELNVDKPRVNLQLPSLGSVSIEYDGLEFKVTHVDGEVWVNNIEMSDGVGLPECCVIAFGGPHRPARERTFVTMDVSHPEVVL